MSFVWNSEFFTDAEMACHCANCKGVVQMRHQESALKLARSLDVVRRIIGIPITITSAGRCLTHHKSIYAAMGKTGDAVPTQSEHLYFRAADLKIKSDGKQLSGLEMKGMFEILIKLRHIPNGGLGVYADRPNILHYDQGEVRRWSG